jgi:DNA-binding GntR family transcriptional regulator
MLSWIVLHWKAGALVACAIGIAAASARFLDTEQARVQRAERRRERELRLLADRIATYGRIVHRRYPTGDVVVSERDLAERFRKPPDTIAVALNILLGEKKVQRAVMSGYWNLTA